MAERARALSDRRERLAGARRVAAAAQLIKGERTIGFACTFAVESIDAIDAIENTVEAAGGEVGRDGRYLR